MAQFVSPRQIARAAGVSESSVKRWCDQGLLPSVKTAGGHRRLDLAVAAEHLQRICGVDASKILLGMAGDAGAKSAEDWSNEFYIGLLKADEAECRRLLLSLHLAGWRAAKICDEVFVPAFQRIGAAWECSEVQVYQERLGCGIGLRLLEELKIATPTAQPSAQRALGAAPAGDPYLLPTSMVEVVLRQSGWQAYSLGADFGFGPLIAAIRDLHPQLVWLSVSHLDDVPTFLAGYREFYESVHSETAVVVGGRALVEPLRREMRYAAYCDNLQHLESFADALKRGAAPQAERT